MGKGRCLGVIVLVLLGLSGSLAAEEPARDLGYLEGSAKKLGRGAANILTAPLELIREPYLASEQEGAVSGITTGLTKGIFSTLLRAGAGVVELATFFVPFPKGYQPLIEPEFIYAHGDWVK